MFSKTEQSDAIDDEPPKPHVETCEDRPALDVSRARTVIPSTRNTQTTDANRL